MNNSNEPGERVAKMRRHDVPGNLASVPIMLDTRTHGGGSLGLGAEEGRGKRRYATAMRMQQ